MKKIIIVFLVTIFVSSFAFAGNVTVKKKIRETLRQQQESTTILQKSLEDIQKIIKPIKIPKGVRIKKKK